ncbi:membrane protein [Beggiatoa sp. PS]|nr:membrane protein [Beggiatoa sp. PS]
MVSPVNILTLRTTSTEYEVSRPWWKAIFLGSGSVGRNFFRKLFWVATLIIVVILTLHVLLEAKNAVLIIFEPFLYGALGAVIYVYKNLTDRYINRTLHPYELSTDWLRIFMGGITGGLIVHLFGPFLPDTIVGISSDQTTGEGLNVTNMAFGFLAGYSVEFFYQLLDKIIHSITPASQSQESQVVPSSPRQVQIELLTKSLKEMTDEEDKAIIRGLLEKI